ncbi:PP2C family protein-serine/threonine phosphatase [Halalkalibacter sp. APA_J-10(15)]|uniref:PP2C family protein-serine/threonine phosphatase n=1 Tax=unclassified Halalkalibacter TaxID=2893063 RepID=UPI001FF16EC7|nr:PP2C family protein-serine/threonine phosphatase [Halalkalibacter sp. APA_J-10(15)]MCK0473870.1 PP2C family protein-serine/threonine phosphatase [Halalkalibacter sp. APA_J-10(15)]
MDKKVTSLEQEYLQILQTFLHQKSEKGLYQAQQFSKRLLEEQVSPEEFVSVHRSVLVELFPNVQGEMLDSFDLLLEVMMGYGLAYREHQSLRDRQLELESEIDVAASMQQTLLPERVPQTSSLDIGVISVAANKMSGDYYHFIQEENNRVGVAIADIIGKGVPAALCMSMIKYAMDSLSRLNQQPGVMLENVNRVVEQNISDNMFITMMYGSYDINKHLFYYASAGHEPGFFYNANNDAFEELYAKGMVLGLASGTAYKEYEKSLNVGDFVVLLSDGVTESRNQDRFIEREEIVTLLRQTMHASAQEMVQHVYEEMSKWQEYELKDDFTMIILKRNV